MCARYLKPGCATLPSPMCYLWSRCKLTKTSGTTESKNCCQHVEGVVISSRAADSSVPTHLHGENATWALLSDISGAAAPCNCGSLFVLSLTTGKKKKKKGGNCPMRGNTKVRPFCRLGPVTRLPDVWISHLKLSLFQQQPRAVCFKRNKSEHCLSAAQLFQLFCLSCFPRINVHCFNVMVSMVHQGCLHTQQGAWAALSESVFPSLPVSGSLCLTFKPCLLTLLVKTGLYFSFLECAGLV